MKKLNNEPKNSQACYLFKSASSMAKKFGVNKSTVARWCSEANKGNIGGAYAEKVNNRWDIWFDEKPTFRNVAKHSVKTIPKAKVTTDTRYDLQIKALEHLLNVERENLKKEQDHSQVLENIQVLLRTEINLRRTVNDEIYRRQGMANRLLAVSTAASTSGLLVLLLSIFQ